MTGVELAAVLTALAAVIGAVTGLATVISPFIPKRPAPPEADHRSTAAKVIDRFSLIPTGLLNGKNGKAPE